MRLIDLTTSEELVADTLTMNRYETLSSNDYHLSVLPSNYTASIAATSRFAALGSIVGLGSGLWDASLNAASLLNPMPSSASVRSAGSDRKTSFTGAGIPSIRSQGVDEETPEALLNPGMKIYIFSPYDCVLANKRDLADHLEWLQSQEKFEESWNLIDEHPEVVAAKVGSEEATPSSPNRRATSIDDFYTDDNISEKLRQVKFNSPPEKEKRRIGELWLQQLVREGDWETAGVTTGKVLGTADRWEYWVWTFAEADKFEEIIPYVPTTQLNPPLPSMVYEVLIGHYISQDRLKLKEILETWSSDLFDRRSIITALEAKLKGKDVSERAVQDGQPGRDWRILMEGTAKLLLEDGRPREALKYYIRLKDADEAMALIRDHHLLDAVSDDIPGLIFLRISDEQIELSPRSELEEASSEVVELLVREAHHGIVRPGVVVSQLKDGDHDLFLYFYLKRLLLGDEEKIVEASEGKSQVEEFGDLAVEIFAEYDRSLLMDFLKASQSYSFEKVSCTITSVFKHTDIYRHRLFANAATTFPSLSISSPRLVKQNVRSF
jgi:vacuolar protein sorting-associated protein 41